MTTTKNETALTGHESCSTFVKERGLGRTLSGTGAWKECSRRPVVIFCGKAYCRQHGAKRAQEYLNAHGDPARVVWIQDAEKLR